VDFSIEELYCQYIIYPNITWEFIIRKIGRVWEGCLVIIICKVKYVLHRHFFENWILWRGVILYVASWFIQVIWHVRLTQEIQQFIWYMLWKEYSTRSPFVTLLSRPAQSGRWSSFGKWVWFTESHLVLIIPFFYLFYLLSLSWYKIKERYIQLSN